MLVKTLIKNFIKLGSTEYLWLHLCPWQILLLLLEIYQIKHSNNVQYYVVNLLAIIRDAVVGKTGNTMALLKICEIERCSNSCPPVLWWSHQGASLKLLLAPLIIMVAAASRPPLYDCM